ncbi:MAG: hypothetical protein R2684_13355 [Pyrinomonadaceae bacterium]
MRQIIQTRVFLLFAIMAFAGVLEVAAQSTSAETIQVLKGTEKVYLDEILRETVELDGHVISLEAGESLSVVQTTGTARKWRLVSSDPLASVKLSSDEETLIAIKKGGRAHIELIDKAGAKIELAGVKRILIDVRDEQSRQITSDTTFLSYRDVRDNFGKRISEQYMVVQITIRNDSAHDQFYLQDISVMLDPRQCRKVQEYLSDIGPYKYEKERTGSGGEEDTIGSERRFKECVDYYFDTFVMPAQMNPVARDIVLGVGDAGFARSKRRIGFSALKFAAELGSVFTGLKLLGPDGVKGFGFLGSTILPSADTAIPDISAAKSTRLRDSMASEATIVNSRDYRVLNIFLPRDRLLSSGSWNNYKISNGKKVNDNAFKLKVYLELFLVAQVKGILITDQAPRITLEPGGGANNLVEFSQ